MRKHSYESFRNDKDESSGDDGVFTARRKEKSSLKIRLNRVFSAGSLKSPKSPGACASLSDSRGSSPGRGNSPSSKSRYSWQPSGVGGDNRSPQRSPICGTPSKGSPVRSSASTDSPAASPSTPKTPQSATTWYEDARMKYSPQQQQKERKSESDSLNLTASGDLESRTRAAATTVSSNTRQDSSGTSTNSRFSICRRGGSSTGMFAWMRVFRLASMLHQIGC